MPGVSVAAANPPNVRLGVIPHLPSMPYVRPQSFGPVPRPVADRLVNTPPIYDRFGSSRVTLAAVQLLAGDPTTPSGFTVDCVCIFKKPTFSPAALPLMRAPPVIGTSPPS